MLHKLLNSLIIEPKIKLSSQIVTAADAGFYLGLQLLVASLKQTHEAQLHVVDLGLAEDQQDWLTRHGCILVPMPESIYPVDQPHWQQWNKVAYLQHFSGPVIWLDADTLVRGSLEWLEEAAKHRPVATICYAAQMYVENVDACLRNHPKLYERFQVNRRLETCPNNGVIALNIERDHELLEQWAYLTQEAARDESLRPLIRFWDQGAFQWALEATGNRHILIHEMRWNDAQSVFGECTMETFVERISKAKSNILHFAGINKAYNGLGVESLPIDLSTREDLMLYVLDHQRPEPLPKPTAPHIQQINLDDLPFPQELAESRIYLSDVLDRCQTEYVGLCSAAWDQKYKELCRPISQLHKLKLEPHVVWAGCRAPDDWPHESERQHPQIMQPIKELARACGAQQLHRPSVWNNNFICHRDVLADFLSFWRQAYAWLRERYGDYVPYDNAAYDERDLQRFGRTRRWAYVCERLALLYFANRTDLIIAQCPR